MSLASVRRRTIVLMEPRCSPPPPCSAPSFLLALPFSPWHNCCIAADVISCFLLGLSAVGPHLTFSPPLSDCTFSFQQSSYQLSHTLFFIFTSPSHNCPVTLIPPLCVSPQYVLLVLSCSSYPLLLFISFCVCCANCAVVLFPLLSLQRGLKNVFDEAILAALEPPEMQRKRKCCIF